MLKQIEKKRLKNFVKKKIGERQDLYDIESKMDNSLNYWENKRIINEDLIEKFNISYENIDNVTKKEAEIIPKEKVKEVEVQELQKIEKYAESEFNKTLNDIEKQETTKTIEDIYFIPKQYAKMVAGGFSRGFLLFGEAGTGKTYSVMRAFQETGKKFVLLTGHITSMELYHFIFEHRKENIVLDDVNVLNNEENLNLLKSCLNENSRIVQYHTTSSRLRVPNQFIFEGSLIILLNNVPKKTESLRAVESRILTYELKLDYKTKIKILIELAKQDYKDINKDDRQNIVKWIKENTSEATENLNLRLLFMCYEFFRFDKHNWKKMALNLIQNNYYLDLIVQGLNSAEWCEKTGLSARTYRRYKNKLISSGGHLDIK